MKGFKNNLPLIKVKEGYLAIFPLNWKEKLMIRVLLNLIQTENHGVLLIQIPLGEHSWIIMIRFCRIWVSGPSPLTPTQKNMIFKHFLKRNDPNFHMGYAIKRISSRAHNIKFKNLFKLLTILMTSYFAKWSLPLCRKSRVLANGPSLLFGDVVYGCPLM